MDLSRIIPPAASAVNPLGALISCHEDRGSVSGDSDMVSPAVSAPFLLTATFRTPEVPTFPSLEMSALLDAARQAGALPVAAHHQLCWFVPHPPDQGQTQVVFAFPALIADGAYPPAEDLAEQILLSGLNYEDGWVLPTGSDLRSGPPRTACAPAIRCRSWWPVCARSAR